MKLRLFLLMAVALLLAFAGSRASPATGNSTGPAATITPRVSTVVISATAPAGSFGFQHVLCPEGTVALGGGIDVDNVFAMQVSSSAPIFPDGRRLLDQADGAGPAPVGWWGAAINDADTTQSFKVAVTCADMADVSTMISSTSVGSDNFNDEWVLCPEGTVALGGGVDLENVLSMEVSLSAPTFLDGERLLDLTDGAGPAPVGWGGAAINNAGVTRSFKVAAICADMAGVSTMIGSETILAYSFGGPRVLCPEGAVALGGGIDPANILYMAVTSSAAVFPDGPTGERLIQQDDGTGPAPVGWQGTAISKYNHVTTIKVGAICAPASELLFLPIVLR